MVVDSTKPFSECTKNNYKIFMLRCWNDKMIWNAQKSDIEKILGVSIGGGTRKKYGMLQYNLRCKQ